MVIYNPKDWIKLIFQFHKSDTFRVLLPAMAGIGVLTAIGAYVILDFFDLHYKSTIMVHSLLGFVLSLLLVFRTNTAYERWWEGRKLWGGFVNTSRSLSVRLAAYVDDPATRRRLRVLISNFFFAAKEHLRLRVDINEWDSCEGVDNQALAQHGHVPNAILSRIMQEIAELHRNGKLTEAQLLSVNEDVRALANDLGACERIRSTPIPYSYSIFIKKIIFLYTVTLPFGLIPDFRYWTIPVAMLIFYTFASFEVIAEEIEDPFGHDANDLPTDELSVKIREQLKEIYGG